MRPRGARGWSWNLLSLAPWSLTSNWSALSLQLLVPASVNCLRLGSMMCTLLLILLRQWKR